MKVKLLPPLLLGALFLLASTSSYAFLDALWKKKSKHGIQNAQNIDPKVLDLGMRAHQCAVKMGIAKKEDILTIIDYSKPSSQKRLWIVDLDKKEVTSEQLVAHGTGSGEHKSTKFSNKNGSHQSSIGVFRTAEPYDGKNGLSLRLDGLEQGINDQARQRAVVIHGANYVSDDFVEKYGRLGRSWGCPALDLDKSKETIHKIKGGSIVVAYYPDSQWMRNSRFLHC